MPAYIYYSNIDNEDTMRLYRQGLTDIEIAEKLRGHYNSIRDWRKRHNLPPNTKSKESEEYLADIKKCRKCEYWRGANSNSSEMHFCHHLLDTGKCRQRGEGKDCLSFRRKRT